MAGKITKGFKIITVTAIVVFFAASLMLSTSSFSGYVISEEADNNLNMLSLVFFMLGLLCSFFYLSRFRRRIDYGARKFK